MYAVVVVVLMLFLRVLTTLFQTTNSTFFIFQVREKLQEQIDEMSGGSVQEQKNKMNTMSTFMDECEILEYPYADNTSEQNTKSWEDTDSLSTKKSSHKLVSICADGKTPSRLRDGEFSK